MEPVVGDVPLAQVDPCHCHHCPQVGFLDGFAVLPDGRVEEDLLQRLLPKFVIQDCPHEFLVDNLNIQVVLDQQQPQFDDEISAIAHVEKS